MKRVKRMKGKRWLSRFCFPFGLKHVVHAKRHFKFKTHLSSSLAHIWTLKSRYESPLHKWQFVSLTATRDRSDYSHQIRGQHVWWQNAWIIIISKVVTYNLWACKYVSKMTEEAKGVKHCIYLNSSFGEVSFLSYFFSSINVWIMGFLKGSFKFFKLGAGEGCPYSPLLPFLSQDSVMGMSVHGWYLSNWTRWLMSVVRIMMAIKSWPWSCSSDGHGSTWIVIGCGSREVSWWVGEDRMVSSGGSVAVLGSGGLNLAHGARGGKVRIRAG